MHKAQTWWSAMDGVEAMSYPASTGGVPGEAITNDPEYEARLSLFNTLADRKFSHDDFQLYLDTYLRKSGRTQTVSADDVAELPVLPVYTARLGISPLDSAREQADVTVTGSAMFVNRVITAAAEALQEEAER